MWDVLVPTRTANGAEYLVAKRLPDMNKLLRVVGWSANGGWMCCSGPGPVCDGYEVCCWVQLAV